MTDEIPEELLPPPMCPPNPEHDPVLAWERIETHVPRGKRSDEPEYSDHRVVVFRLPIPGGWLYRMRPNVSSKRATVLFVPAAVSAPMPAELPAYRGPVSSPHERLEAMLVDAGVVEQGIYSRRLVEDIVRTLDFHENAEVIAENKALANRIELALETMRRFGGIDGDHHKAWTIDQVARALLGPGYAAFVADARSGEDGPETYSWDVGIAP